MGINAFQCCCPVFGRRPMWLDIWAVSVALAIGLCVMAIALLSKKSPAHGKCAHAKWLSELWLRCKGAAKISGLLH